MVLLRREPGGDSVHQVRVQGEVSAGGEGRRGVGPGRVGPVQQLRRGVPGEGGAEAGQREGRAGEGGMRVHQRVA